MQWLCSQLCYVTAANQWTFIEIELFAFVGWKCGCQPFSCPCSQNVIHCGKEIRSTCLSKESMPFDPFVKSKPPLPTRTWVPKSGSTFHQLCITLLFLHHAHPFLAAAEKKKKVENACLMLRSRGFGLGVVVSKICYNAVIVLSVCYVTAANQWTIVEIELLATVGWKWGCQPFSCPCSKNLIHFPKEMCSTCLSKESMPFNNFLQSRPPLPTRSLSSRERQYAPPALHYIIIVASCPSVRCSCRKKEKGRKRLSYAEKQRVWSRSCGLQDLLQMQWLCSQLCYVTAANQWTIVEIELLATVGWKWGCQPFSCPCAQNVTHCRKEMCSTCLSKESMPFNNFLKSKPPLPTRSLSSWERQHAPPPLHCGCIMPIPSLQLQEKTCLMQRSRGFGHGVVVCKICYNAVIVLSVVLCDCWKPMNNCRDWAFSNSGLEVGLPAFQLLAKCDTLPKGDVFDILV